MSSAEQSSLKSATPDPAAGWRILLGLTLAIYWIALFIGTHLPLPEFVPTARNTDKWMHFGAYTGLAYLAGLWLWSLGRTRLRPLLALVIVLACYAVVDELLQIPVNRHADIYDAICDWLGIAAGMAAFSLTRAVRHRMRPPVAAASTADL